MYSYLEFGIGGNETTSNLLIFLNPLLALALKCRQGGRVHRLSAVCEQFPRSRTRRRLHGRPIAARSLEVAAFVYPSVLPRMGVWVMFGAGVTSAAVRGPVRAFCCPRAPFVVPVRLGAQRLVNLSSLGLTQPSQHCHQAGAVWRDLALLFKVWFLPLTMALSLLPPSFDLHSFHYLLTNV